MAELRRLHFEELEPPCAGGRLEAFQLQSGIVLPKDYRDFLLLHDGGQPSSRNNYIDTHGVVPGGDICINCFLSVAHELEVLRLGYELELFREHFEELDLLPIAVDDFGNRILLDCGESGSVSIWITEWNSESGVVPLFDSFRAFLDALAPEPDA